VADSEKPARIVLASASPRRRELQQKAGLEFDVVVPDVDESVDPVLSPEEAACALAEKKAGAVAARIRERNVVVLGADTIVAVGEGADARMLGKPEGPDEARAMLRALSGTRHRVITGVCAVAGVAVWSGFERSWVSMRPIERSEIEAYVESGVWGD
jgi:septum formation protein